VAESVAVSAIRGYRDIAIMWTRASMAYRASFWMMAISSFVIGGLDFVGIWIMFSAVDSLGGFGLAEIAFLYGATGLGLAIADMFVGRVERLGQMVRLGKLDVMMVRPVPLLAQVCADEFALRRLARVVQTGLIFGVGCAYVDWSPTKVLLAAVMIGSGAAIFFAVFVGFACLQFWTADSSEVANAFTYGGNTMTQYPLTIYPQELVKTLTFVFPLAFVNWYPSLYILDREDPFGLPEWLQFASPVAALVLLAGAAVAWRTGVRHYTSTGS
jgi:ABC-2 type transport system permease protein